MMAKQLFFNLFIFLKNLKTFNKNAISLTNLERLGIIIFKKDTFLANDSEYNFIRNSNTITHLLMSHP